MANNFNVLNYLSTNFGITFTPAQKAIITDTNKQVVTLAVPGSGKTTVLVAHIANLIKTQQLKPKSIMALSYNRESAKSLNARFELYFGAIFEEKPRFSTIHSFAYTVVKNHLSATGRAFPQMLTGLADGVSQHSIVRGCLLEITSKYPEEDEVMDMIAQISLSANSLGTLDTSALPYYFDKLLAAYKNKKQQLGVIDFDDLLTICHHLLKTQPQLAEKYSRHYPYIYLDEAQDSSKLQLEILGFVTKHSKLFFVVGDEDQSIYSFRGAQPEAIMNLVERHKIQPHKMEVNFRCSSNIVAMANNLIACNTKRIAKNMQAVTEASEPKVLALGGTHELADYLCQKLAALENGKTAAVLYRNSASAIVIADRLAAQGTVFYVKDSGRNILKSTVVDDVLAIMSLFDETYKLENFRRVYYKLGAYISKDIFEKAARAHTEGEKTEDMLDRLKHHGASTAKIRMLEYTFKNMRSSSPAKILHSILYDLEYLNYLKTRSEKGQFFELSAQQLRALEYLAEGTKNIEEFEEKIESIGTVFANAAEKSGSSITLSTIHSAKGLEFDEVYVIDLQEGVLPSASSLLNIPGAKKLLEEERRLFYVAITRAKTTLELIYLKSYGTTKLTPSRFLRETTNVSDKYAKEAYPGRSIHHRFFGAGEIYRVDPEDKTVEIHFRKGGMKKFVISVLEENDIIKFV